MICGILTLILVLFVPVQGQRSELVPVDMCSNATQTATSPELILMNNAKLYSPNMHVCSCNISSAKDYYISLKRFNIPNGKTAVISMTENNETRTVDLNKMDADQNGTDCLLLSGERCQPFRPKHCLRTTTSKSITLVSFKNLTGDSYISLYILAEEKVTVNCQQISYLNNPGEGQMININSNQSEACNATSNNNNGVSGDNNTNSNDTHIQSCENAPMPCEDTTEETTVDTNVNTTSVTGTTEILPALYDIQTAERMMTASMILLPVAVIVLLISLTVFALTYRRHWHGQQAVGTKRKSISRRGQKQEAPSYYDEVDEDLHISTNGPPSTVSKDNQNKVKAEYDLATSPDVESLVMDYGAVTALVNNNYEVATALSANATEKISNEDESDYNVASYNPAKKKSTAGVEGTYDVTKPTAPATVQNDNDRMVYEMGVPFVDLDASTDLDQTGSQKSLISAEPKYEPAQLTSMSNSLPSVETEPKIDNVYSLELMVSLAEKTQDVIDDDITHDNNEGGQDLATSDERTSLETDVLDDELYANFSSLKSEDHGTSANSQENSEEEEEEEEEEIYINHPMHIKEKQHSGETSPKTSRKSLSLVPVNTKRPGYINVQMDRQNKRQSIELTDSTVTNNGDAKVHLDVDDTGSTVCLLNSTPDSEVYANYEAKVDSSKMDKRDKKVRKSKGDNDGMKAKESTPKGRVEVIVLPQVTASPAPVQQQTKGHKPSSSVDESSRLQRKPDSRKQRTRSDETFLLNPITTSRSGSEDDVPVMVNNQLYDNSHSRSLDSMLRNEASANPSTEMDPNQFPFLPTEDDAEDDAIIMMQNDLYESFKCGGVSILPENVSQEMEEKLMKKYHISPVNESRFSESEKL